MKGAARMNKAPRIASLCPSNTEIVHALGLSKYLVAVDNYSDYPIHVVNKVPKVGPDLQIDMDRLAALKPDLTLSSLSVPGMEKVVANAASANLTQIVLSPHSMTDIYNDMYRVAAAVPEVLSREDVDAVVNRLKHRVDRIQALTASLRHRPRLYWEWWMKPIFSPAKENWLTELSELAGAVNIFGDHPGDQVQDDGESVTEANPDYYLAVWTGVPQHKVPLTKLFAHGRLTETSMFLNKRVYVLSEGLYCRPSPRLIDGLEQLTQLLHPEIGARLQLEPAHKYGPIREWSGTWLGGRTPMDP
jgi:iron complex transport system substrate-binding protein